MQAAFLVTYVRILLSIAQHYPHHAASVRPAEDLIIELEHHYNSARAASPGASEANLALERLRWLVSKRDFASNYSTQTSHVDTYTCSSADVGVAEANDRSKRDEQITRYSREPRSSAWMSSNRWRRSSSCLTLLTMRVLPLRLVRFGSGSPRPSLGHAQVSLTRL